MKNPTKPARIRRREAIVSRAVTKVENKQTTKRSFETERVDAGTLEDVEHVARVRVDSGLTINLGDGNFIKISVGMDMPCLPDRKSRLKCYDRLSEDVAELLEIEYKNTLTTKDSL